MYVHTRMYQCPIKGVNYISQLIYYFFVLNFARILIFDNINPYRANMATEEQKRDR